MQATLSTIPGFEACLAIVNIIRDTTTCPAKRKMNIVGQGLPNVVVPSTTTFGKPCVGECYLLRLWNICAIIHLSLISIFQEPGGSQYGRWQSEKRVQNSHAQRHTSFLACQQGSREPRFANCEEYTCLIATWTKSTRSILRKTAGARQTAEGAGEEE